jgi:uncharacterized protein (TIGR02246 family)
MDPFPRQRSEGNPRLATAESVHQALSQSMNSGDIDGIVSLYEEGASLTRRDGRKIIGHDAIRAHFTSLMELKPTITIEPPRVITDDGVPVLVAKWQLSGATANGETINEEGCTYDVVRQQVDGTWRLIFDNPWGGSAV